MRFLLVLAIAVVGLTQALPPNLDYDFDLFYSLNCDVNNPPIITIATVSQLLNITNIRLSYPNTQLVIFHLTAVNTFDQDGNITASAYDTQTSLLPTWGSSMSCSYVYGSGAANTQILVDTLNSVLVLQGASDIIVADVYVDRYPLYNTIMNECLNAANYDQMSAILNNTICLDYLAGTSSITNEPQAIMILASSRIKLIRIQTEGGVTHSVSNGIGTNITVASSSISSISGGGTIFSINGIGGLFIFNNTILAPWGSAIFTNQHNPLTPIFSEFSYNQMQNLGWSCFYLRRSYFIKTYYNDCRMFALAPTSAGGAAGFYTWNAQGWSTWGLISRYNYYYSPRSECYYIDSTNSNVDFEFNICFTSWSEINNGRFNYMINNIHFINRGTHLGDINCSNMQTTPPFLTCESLQQSPASNSQLSYLPDYVWSNYFPNGTMTQTAPYSGFYLEASPNFAYDTWCTKTAGPNNTVCIVNSTSYSYNGTTYVIPCETLPSQNRFGFVVIYNTTSQPGPFNSGYGCVYGPSNANPSFPNYSHDASAITLQVNFFNITYYSTLQYSNTDLFGVPLDMNDIEPKLLNILPGSVLYQNNPELIGIPFQQIGLQTYCPQLSAPALGSISCTNNNGSIVTTTQCNFSCNEDYSVFGASVLTCQLNAQWDNPAPICTRNDCPPLTAPTNGALTFTLGRQDTSVGTYSCFDGYNLSSTANSITTCENSNWSNTPPTCNIVQNYCPAVTSPANGLLSCSSSQEIGSICLTTCEIGSKMNGTSAAQCISSTQTTGVWNISLATCPLITNYCPSVTLNNGALSCTSGQTVNSVCSFACNLGYYLTISNGSSTCLPSSSVVGIWSPSVPSCASITSYCPGFGHPVDGSFPTYSSFQRIGTVATFSCNANYVVIGPSTLTCDGFNSTVGIWSGAMPQCGPASAYCPYLSIPNGVASCTNGQAVNSSCSFSCNQGYTINSTTTLVCQNTNTSAVWIGGSLPSCSVTNYCPALPPVANGNWACTAGQHLSSSCALNCSSTYTPSSTAPVTCLTFNSTNGIWNSNVTVTCNPGNVTASPSISPSSPAGSTNAASPTPSGAATADSTNTVALGVGLGVGLAALLVLIFLAIFLVRRYRRQPYQPASEMKTYSAQ